MFDRLEFIYMPSRDAAGDVEHFVAGLGAERVFAIEAFGTRVAMVRVSADGPAVLLAEHLDGDQPVLVYRVDDLDAATRELELRGVRIGHRFGIPQGSGLELVGPGPQRIAIFEELRPGAGDKLAGRRDF